LTKEKSLKKGETQMTKGYSFGLKKEDPSIAVARFMTSNHGEHYEVSIDPDKAIEYKKGLITDVREVIHSEDIFTDVKKGLRPSQADLERVFKTTDKLKIIDQILKHGMLQVSEMFREGKRVAVRNKIIELIHRNAADPTTNLPHPLTRIENALAQIKFKIDENRSPEDQVADIVKKLQIILPIKFETKEIWIQVPAQFVSKAIMTIKQFTQVTKQSFESDGSLTCTVEIPVGMQEDFFDKLNSTTKGEAVTKVLHVK